MSLLCVMIGTLGQVVQRGSEGAMIIFIFSEATTGLSLAIDGPRCLHVGPDLNPGSKRHRDYVQLVFLQKIKN